MSRGSIIGYDINTKMCQISVYNENLQEPESVDFGRENFQIPLAANYYKEEWTYGKNAIRMVHIGLAINDVFVNLNGCIVDHALISVHNIIPPEA